MPCDVDGPSPLAIRETDVLVVRKDLLHHITECTQNIQNWNDAKCPSLQITFSAQWIMLASGSGGLAGTPSDVWLSMGQIEI